MSFTQNVFHPASMPHGNQYVYVYGSKGAVDLMTGTMYPPGRGAQPVVLAPKQQEDEFAHIAAFYESIVHGAPPPVDVKGGATAALTAILGHEAMVQEKSRQVERLRHRPVGGSGRRNALPDGVRRHARRQRKHAESSERPAGRQEDVDPTEEGDDAGKGV